MRSFQNVLETMKTGGVLLPRLDSYLTSLDTVDEEHSHRFISPSGLFGCKRSVAFRMRGVSRDVSVNPRLRRIFDTGSAIHEQIQGYLLQEGVLQVKEAPVFNKSLNLIGHTDGILELAPLELAILEIKSINTDECSRLKEPKPQHKFQANTYMLFLEIVRKRVNKSKSKEAAMDMLWEEYSAMLSTFVSGGKKRTTEEKMQWNKECLQELVDFFWGKIKPIQKVIFYYYDKNNSDHKEFIVEWDDALIEAIICECHSINAFVAEDTLPPRVEGATGKSSASCRYCDYKLSCYS